MKNIEIKVAVPRGGDFVKSLKKLGADYKGKIRQVDTYYNFPDGRLKIREANQNKAELIYYKRPDQKRSKISHYKIIKINPKQLNAIKKIFKDLFGQKVIVKKIRELWIYKNTRIHLDQVNNLGDFVELETVIKNRHYQIFQKEHNKVIEALSLLKFKTQGLSYSDLLLLHSTKSTY